MHLNQKQLLKNCQKISGALALQCKPVPSLYTISRTAFKNKKLRQALISHTCSELNRDCQKLVKKKSVLRSNSIQDLKSFKWLKLLSERKKEAPILYSKAKPSLRPFIGAAGAILLKGINQRMSAVQHLVGLCLFLGRTRKKVSKLIKKCMIINVSCQGKTIFTLRDSLYKSQF